MGNDILQKNRLLFPFECKILYFFFVFPLDFPNHPVYIVTECKIS